MTKSVYVTSAQVDAARFLAKQNEATGQPVSTAVRKIAEATTRPVAATSPYPVRTPTGGAMRRMGVYLGLVEDDEYVEEEILEPADASLSTGEPSEPSPVQITALHPRTYNEARAIGDAFNTDAPVLVNLSAMADEDAKRLVDFMAGLTFGAHGRIERISAKVFLLAPHDVVVGAQAEAERSGGPKEG